MHGIKETGGILFHTLLAAEAVRYVLGHACMLRERHLLRAVNRDTWPRALETYFQGWEAGRALLEERHGPDMFGFSGYVEHEGNLAHTTCTGNTDVTVSPRHVVIERDAEAPPLMRRSFRDAALRALAFGSGVQTSDLVWGMPALGAIPPWLFDELAADWWELDGPLRAELFTHFGYAQVSPANHTLQVFARQGEDVEEALDRIHEEIVGSMRLGGELFIDEVDAQFTRTERALEGFSNAFVRGVL